jgi:hypothetical protein
MINAINMFKNQTDPSVPKKNGQDLNLSDDDSEETKKDLQTLRAIAIRGIRRPRRWRMETRFRHKIRLNGPPKTNSKSSLCPIRTTTLGGS